MRQIAFSQIRKLSRLFSWNCFYNNVAAKYTCNGNLNSHIVPKTATTNMLYKRVPQNIFNDEISKKVDANNEVASKTVETISVFTLLIKLMKIRLNKIINKISREPQSIIEYITWKIRELLLSAIIGTGFPGARCRDAHGVAAPDSYLHRCSSSLSGYLFSRHPMFTFDTPFRSYMGRYATLGVTSSLIASLHGFHEFKSQPIERDVVVNPLISPRNTSQPPDLKATHATRSQSGVSRSVIAHLQAIENPRVERDITCESLSRSWKERTILGGTLGMRSSLIASLHGFHGFKSQPIERDVVVNPLISPRNTSQPPDLKATQGSSKDKLIWPLCEKSTTTDSKASVVGIGQVGFAAVVKLLTQGTTHEIAMVNRKADKLEGETLDLMHGSLFVNKPRVTSSTDYAISAGSRVCIICAGVKQKDEETRLDLVQRNAEVLKDIIPELAKHSPDTVFIVATNPVDILAWVTWKINRLPKNRVIGSGTLLDSARFRYMISKKLGIATTSIHAHIIGEHGDSRDPVWSGVNTAGVRLRDLHPQLGTEQDPEGGTDLHTSLLDEACKECLLFLGDWFIARKDY